MVDWTQSNTLLLCADVSFVIGISQGYWLEDEDSLLKYHGLDDKGATLVCHWLDDKGLTPASHCYGKVVARWLEVLASYAGQSNLMVIMSGIVLELLRA